MSDHEHHEDHGAHEVDKMPSSRLFNLLFGLSALTLVACIGVVQLFYRQVDTIRDTRNTKVSFQLAEYRQEMDELKSGWTVVELTDDDGVPEKDGGKSVHQNRRTQMPLAEARTRVLEQPQKFLKAEAQYPRWPNPDPNAPKARAPLGPRPPGRMPAQRPVRVPAQPMGAGQPQPGVVAPPARVIAPPAEAPKPTAPAEGKAPKGEPKAPKAPKGEPKAPKAPKAPAEGKGEPKAPAEGKAEPTE